VGEGLLRTDETVYDEEIRNALFGEQLRRAPHLAHLAGTAYAPRSLPLAATRRNEQYVDWTGPAELGAPVRRAGADPQFLENGSALHIHGGNRIGIAKATSVADPVGRVWVRANQYVAGNATIPKGIACNPTLTSVCLAVRTAMAILGRDTSGTFAPADRAYVDMHAGFHE